MKSMTAQERNNMLLNDPVSRVIPKLAIPTIISMLITNVYNMADTFFVSQIGTSASGAVGVIFSAMAIIQAFSFMIGMGSGTHVSQALGAGDRERLKQGFRQATIASAVFSAVISALVFVFANPLMRIFVQAGETQVLAAGVLYLRVEGACYVGIGCLFLLYGFYRAIKRPGMSVVLTVISLGTRVVLAYLLAGPIGEIGIWIAIPIGWVLADLTGYGYYFRHKQKLLPQEQK